MNNGWTFARELGATLLRLALGAYYLMHAYYAGAVIGIPALAQANATRYMVPLPELSAWYIVLGHGAGGLMLLIGLYPRIGALLNIPIMAGAFLFVHLNQGFFMRGMALPDGRAAAAGFEYSLFLLLATAASLLIGGGRFTLRTARKGGRISLD
ncbi:MAG: DoxX family protein [Candidatus Tectomicrobia bacterium]|uniref:DoxX family protein n=1 Tax=Tectimicrobiota bacterium TaxID=2528274 RepID=A0A932I2F6_UNCTE|nr:DoxX family protein [Candidatus Tectomicrobia bacterium]